MRKLFFYISAVLSVGLWACQTEPDSAKLIDQMVVSTNYDPQADFSAYTTYAIPTDTIGFVSNNSNDTIITSPESSFPRQVLNVIKSNLDGRGYTKVARNANPDLGVNVMV